jgi:WD40 repeat protein
MILSARARVARIPAAPGLRTLILGEPVPKAGAGRRDDRPLDVVGHTPHRREKFEVRVDLPEPGRCRRSRRADSIFAADRMVSGGLRITSASDQAKAIRHRDEEAAMRVMPSGSRGPFAGGVPAGLPDLPAGGDLQKAARLGVPDDLESVVAICSDGLLRFWSVSGPRGARLERQWSSADVTDLAAHPGSSRLIGGRADGRLVVRDLATVGPELIPLSAEKPRIRDVAISPDGTSYAATGNDRDIWVGRFGPGPPALLARLADTGQSIAFSPYGRRPASGSIDGTTRTWDASPLPEGVPTP